ncbi:MAG: oligosaccharide flippase family protein [Parvibaculum sp.]|nr:oligosaccharide flippase family protein [Parvibaculum sp.]
MADERKVSLTRLAVSGAFAGVFGKVANAVVGVVTVGILARLLTPIEYGDFGFVAICLAISQLAPQAVSNVIVGKKDITPADVSGGFTLTIVLSVFFAIVLALLRKDISTFFSTDISAQILFAAIVLPALSVTAFLDGLLSKEFEFRKNASFDFVSVLTGQSIVAITLAYYGFGVWALLCGLASSGLIRMALQVSTGSIRHLVFGPISSELVSKTWWIFLSGIGNYLGRNADNIIVGKLLGGASLGLYQRAFNLMMRPIQLFSGSITGVFYPIMSSIQGDEARLQSAYLRGVVVASFIGMPISLFMSLNGKEIIEIIFGPNWSAVAVPFQILALCSYFRLGYRMSDISILSLGEVKIAGAMQGVYAAMIVAGSLVGLQWGLEGVATGVGIALGLYFMISVVCAKVLLKLPIRHFLRAHNVGLIVVLFAIPLNFLVQKFYLEYLGSFWMLALSSIILLLSYVLTLAARRFLIQDSVGLTFLNEAVNRVSVYYLNRQMKRNLD